MVGGGRADETNFQLTPSPFLTVFPWGSSRGPTPFPMPLGDRCPLTAGCTRNGKIEAPSGFIAPRLEWEQQRSPLASFGGFMRKQTAELWCSALLLFFVFILFLIFDKMKSPFVRIKRWYQAIEIPEEHWIYDWMADETWRFL